MKEKDKFLDPIDDNIDFDTHNFDNLVEPETAGADANPEKDDL